jgi:membrane-associated phospholipid phosphatase
LIDLPLTAWFHANQHPLATQLMLGISLWHNTIGLLLMTAVLGIALYRAGKSWWLLSLLLTVPGGMLVNVAVKHIVQRPRPQFDNPIVTLSTYSFPSGHTAGATVFYGFLAVYLLAHGRAQPWRWAIVGAAAAMVLLVGLSRIYLGAHYLSDVVGAVVEGMLWLALCQAGVQALQRRRNGGAA